VNNELEKMQKEADKTKFKGLNFYPGIRLHGLRKPRKELGIACVPADVPLQETIVTFRITGFVDFVRRPEF
jgi:hypothetical protein